MRCPPRSAWLYRGADSGLSPLGPGARQPLQYIRAGIDRVKAKVMFAVQQPLHWSALEELVGVPAWKSLPSWFLIADGDQAIPPDAQRQFAPRMDATTLEVSTNHVAMVFHPDEVVQLIKTARRGGAGRNLRSSLDLILRRESRLSCRHGFEDDPIAEGLERGVRTRPDGVQPPERATSRHRVPTERREQVVELEVLDVRPHASSLGRMINMVMVIVVRLVFWRRSFDPLTPQLGRPGAGLTTGKR